MNYTATTIARSLADYLAPALPGVELLEDPNQQGTSTPAIFLQQRYAYLEKHPSRRFLRRIGLDLTYLEDYNLPDLHQRYLKAAETLDLMLDTFPYQDGAGGESIVHTYDREWAIDLDALHYKFELREIVEAPEGSTKMEEIDLEITVDEEEEASNAQKRQQ